MAEGQDEAAADLLVARKQSEQGWDGKNMSFEAMPPSDCFL